MSTRVLQIYWVEKKLCLKLPDSKMLMFCNVPEWLQSVKKAKNTWTSSSQADYFSNPGTSILFLKHSYKNWDLSKRSLTFNKIKLISTKKFLLELGIRVVIVCLVFVYQKVIYPMIEPSVNKLQNINKVLIWQDRTCMQVKSINRTLQASW